MSISLPLASPTHLTIKFEIEQARSLICKIQNEYHKTDIATRSIALDTIDSLLASAKKNLNLAHITDETICDDLRYATNSYKIIILFQQLEMGKVHTPASPSLPHSSSSSSPPEAASPSLPHSSSSSSPPEAASPSPPHSSSSSSPPVSALPSVSPSSSSSMPMPTPTLSAPGTAIRREESKTPFFQVRPVGIANASNNCWVNAQAQFIRVIPSLHTIALQLKPFEDFYSVYDSSSLSRESIARRANSQTLREFLSTKNPHISSNQNRMEDAHDGLMTIMEPYKGPTLRISRKTSTSEITCSVIPVHINQHNKRTIRNPFAKERAFHELFTESFMRLDDPKGGGKLAFKTPPDELFFQLIRFKPSGKSSIKINDKINCGLRFTLPADQVVSGDTPAYNCDAFISHLGVSMQKGHYICHVEIEDIWYRCDNRDIQKVSKTQVEVAIQNAYLLHYKIIK